MKKFALIKESYNSYEIITDSDDFDCLALCRRHLAGLLKSLQRAYPGQIALDYRYNIIYGHEYLAYLDAVALEEHLKEDDL